MIHLTAQSKILLAIEPVDFRKQIDGLVGLCRHQLCQQPNSGELFVFINKSKTMLRILCYEQNGYWLATKRLSQGHYQWPKKDERLQTVKAHDLTKMLKRVLESDIKLL
jgi:transposase